MHMKSVEKYDLKIKLWMKSNSLYLKGSPLVSTRLGVIPGLLLNQKSRVHSLSFSESSLSSEKR